MKNLPNLKASRILVALILAGLAMSLAPLQSQAAPPGTFSGKAGALAFGLDFLFANPSEPEGIAAGVSTAEANSTPFATGKGAGTCNATPAGTSPVNLPCAGSENLVQATASASGQNDDPAEVCDNDVPVGLASLLNLDNACGNARANVTGADPLGEGEGHVANATVTADLTDIPVVGGAIEDAKDTIVETVEGLTGETIPPELEPAAGLLEALFNTLQGDQNLAVARLGGTKSIVSSSGNVVIARADAAAGTIGILGIPICTISTDSDGAVEPQQQQFNCSPEFPNPLTHGLVILELASTSSEAKWDATPGAAGASATAQPIVVNVKIRDLTKPTEVAYIEEAVSPSTPPLPVLFEDLPLQTTVTVFGSTTSATNEPPGQKGSSSAKSGFVEIHALQGMGGSEGDDCTIAQCDGGIQLRMASTEARVEGALPQPTQVLALPITGGERVFFWAVAVILAASAFLFYRKSSRLRNSV